MGSTTFRLLGSTGGAALLLLLAYAMSFPGGSSAEELLSKTFRSPGFEQGPGDVSDRHFEVEMPPGHVAIRSLYSQLVDENGVPIPPSETYVHHWLLVSQCLSTEAAGSGGGRGDVEENVLWFGLGSELTRATVPPPYGLVIGDPGECGEEKWGLTVHAIDTRGAVDVKGCTECLCRLYNVTVDLDYEGGLRCCYDQTHCAVRPEFRGPRRMLFLEYTVSWVEMSEEVVPVSVHVLDVRGVDRRNAPDDERYCLDVEYTVPKCSEGESECVDTAENVAVVPDGGDVIFAVGHQHHGGLGASLLNEDGDEICSSVPTYANGSEAANDDGYIVGMSSCYPEPGSVKVKGGEKLHLTSSYSNKHQHTGVMGMFYLLVAAESQSPGGKPNFHTNLIMVAVVIVATFVFIGQTITRHLQGRSRRGPEYQLV